MGRGCRICLSPLLCQDSAGAHVLGLETCRGTSPGLAKVRPQCPHDFLSFRIPVVISLKSYMSPMVRGRDGDRGLLWAPWCLGCCSVAKSVSESVWPQGLQHCQAPLSSTVSRSLLKFMCVESVTPTISSSAAHLFCLHSSPASGCFPMSRFFASGGQSVGAPGLLPRYLLIE